MRFFGDRGRERLASENDQPDLSAGRAIAPAQLAGAVHEIASTLARRMGGAPPSQALATILAVLWSRAHSFDAADALWPDRDRFVLSHPAGSPLLYALLHLTGHPGMEQATLDHCGELDAVATLAAEYGRHPAIEVSSTPAGHAIAAAVGMAIAERVLASRFGKSLVDHRVWCVARADELTHGVVEEAAAIAGLLRLDRMVLLVDATEIDAEDARARYAGSGWATKTAAADDAAAIEAGLSFAIRSRKPTLLWYAAAAKAASATPPPALHEAWRRVGTRGSGSRRAWLKRLAHHSRRAEFERVSASRLPEDWQEPLNALRGRVLASGSSPSPAALCVEALGRLASVIPELVCSRSNGAWPNPAERIEPADYSGSFLGNGARPQGMAACINGMALHSGTLPFTAGPFVDTSQQLPALRLAALLGRRIVHLARDEGVGATGRAWRPSGLLPALRAIPNLWVFRPGCPLEVVESLELAIRRSDGPSLLVLARDALPLARAESAENLCARGGYVVAGQSGGRQATLIATGAELPVASAARVLLAGCGIEIAVVSMPCSGLFAGQNATYRDAVLGTAPRFVLEAAGRDGWDRWMGDDGTFIGGDLECCGPPDQMRQRLGLTAPLVAALVRRRLETDGPASGAAAELVLG